MTNVESFGWILYKMMFICDMDTVQTYLEKWGEMRISVMSLPKFLEKVRRERRETWCAREKKKKKNCGNTIVEIRREKIFAIMAI